MTLSYRRHSLQGTNACPVRTAGSAASNACGIQDPCEQLWLRYSLAHDGFNETRLAGRDLGHTADRRNTNMRIIPGTTVRWVNAASIPHHTGGTMSNSRALWLVLILAGCGGGYSTSPPPAPPPPPPPPGGGNPSAANVAMNSSDDGYGSSVNSFNPTSVTIAGSGTVAWSNATGVLHNVTFTPATGSPANIPSFAAGSVSRSFATTGTFSYHCTNHPGMSGQVIVQ